jgi:predicted Zn-dependent protease
MNFKHHTCMRDRLSFFFWGVLLGGCLLAVPARAQLPTLGDGVEMSTSAERRLGDRIARELYRDPDYIDDPVLGEYVQMLWLRLMAAARARGELSPELEERFAWEIALGRDRSVNAFALPGGYLGVHLGLIGTVANQDELASVLAHELSHVTQRHISRLISRQGTQAPWLIGAMILGALAAGKSADVANAMIVGGQAVAVQGQLNFSRDMEREADRVGYGVMTQAGFEPQGFVTMFEKLQQASRLNDSGGFPYLRSHPLTTERIADMQSRQQLLATAAPAAQTLEHAVLAARARVLSQPGVDALRAWGVEAAAPRRAALAPARQAAVLYAAALAASQLRDFEQAGRWQAQLTALVRSDAAAARQARLLGAELALQAGDGRRALAVLGSTPAAPRGGPPLRPELLLTARAQTLSGQAARAAEPLQTWLATHPRDALAWQTLSATYAAQGKTLHAVRAEAEAHAARLDDAAALNRFKAAQDLARQGGAVDHIEASIIDTRTRQIELRQREQALER